MAGRGGGRDRFRPRYEDKTYGGGGGSGRANSPPSRHLWVGNLSHNIEETDFTDHFLRYGELQSVAFQPGRSYAFINFINEGDAIAALKALQGFPLAGNPLKIEFAKADKSLTPSYVGGDHPQIRDEPRSTLRGSPYGQRDSRPRHASSPDPLYPDRSKMSDRSTDPSEVLWIGFPALLKVDEFILRKAFSPFGEIEKITVFSGRSYAFVRFRSITSACRAKETLQGKLFGNPRVHICFARSDGSLNSVRGSVNPSLPSDFQLDGRGGLDEIYRPERSFANIAGDPNIKSPRFIPNSDIVDADVYSLSNRKGALWSGRNNPYEPLALEDKRHQLEFSQDLYEERRSPIAERTSQFHDFPQKGHFYEEPWEAEDDDYYHPGPKKLKTDSFLPDQDLPEYPLSALEQEKHAFSKTFTDIPQREVFDARNIGYKPRSEPRMNLSLPDNERSDHWKAPYDNSQVVSGLPPANPHERKRLTPETDQPSLTDWKWEGTIAKGGTPLRKDGVSSLVGKVVIVGVKAAKEIPRAALVWALTHVVQPGDCIKLLVVVPHVSSSKRIWGISRFASDCAMNRRRSLSSGTISDQKDVIVDSCSQMMVQLHDVYDPEKLKIRVKIIYGGGAVAAEAKKAQSNWVILDKQLRQEKKICMEELQCNVVVMKRSHAKVLRLNLVGSSNAESDVAYPLSYNSELSPKHSKNKNSTLCQIRGPFVTPASSPEQDSPLTTTTDVGTSSVSSSEPGNSPFFVSGNYRTCSRECSFIPEERRDLSEPESDTDGGGSTGGFSQHSEEKSQKTKKSALTSSYEFLKEQLSPSLNKKHELSVRNRRINSNMSKSVREAISLSKKKPPGPPPLCSICQHKAPVFGNPPRWFAYSELEVATNKFSQANFLAEGGFGSVHRGVLPNGQVVAVKQHKLASSQGDQEFCSEVEVLSCAQHRNVVMLIGFCVEDGKRLLVYEYICNGSLDSHLYGRDRDPLPWPARQKIAVGAARGLRYLHEECRVGCIVHRDMRPNNILLTHDFTPLVGDFGLARWQPDGDLGVETRIIGRFGYLAPEYAQTGQITEKADVYSFGVVLVELITGRKAMDINRPKGQQCLSEWARPLLKQHAIDDMLDPRLRDHHSEQEVRNMMRCAYLCIRRDPLARPRMSQVLRMLEGDVIMN